MIFKKYDSYKSSGVEWIDDIPNDWNIYRVASIFKESKEKGEKGLPFLTVSIHNGVSSKELSGKELDRKVLRVEDSSKNKKVRKNYLVYNMMRAWQGGFGTVEVDGMVSPAYVVARPIEEFKTKFIESLFRTPNGIAELKKYSKGIVDFRLRLYWSEFKNIHFALPPFDTQIKIIEYLNKKIKKIDEEVELLEQKIEKYKELKYTLINKIVLRGLDKEVELKSSNIEWIGKIPKHWEIKRLKELGFIETSSVNKKINEDEKIVNLVNYTDVYKSKTKEIYNDVGFMKVSANNLQIKQKILRKGDVLFTPSSETIEDIGISSVVMENLENTLYSYHLLRLRFTSKVDDCFKKFLFNNSAVQYYFSKSVKGTTRKILGLNDFYNLKILIPSYKEQTQIANYLDEKTSKIDTIIETIEEKIKVLKELRKTLINDVVTGKVKVE